MIKENDYLFASSFVRASEKGGSAKERFEKIYSSSTYDSLCKNAAEIFSVDDCGDLEKILENARERCVNIISSSVPDFYVFAPLLYKYDCNNIKTALKCKILGIDCKGRLSHAGYIPAEKIISAFDSGVLSSIGGKMGEAAMKANEAYMKTGEARIIDLMLDRACFEDMTDTAKENGVALISKIVSLRCDAVNILTFIRIKALRMPEESTLSLMERSFVSGGEIPADAFSGDRDNLIKHLTDHPYKRIFCEICDKDLPFAVAEKMLDEVILSNLADVKFMAFGPEIPVRALLVTEAEIMNCRIMARAISEGSDKAEAKERMRFSYA